MWVGADLQVTGWVTSGSIVAILVVELTLVGRDWGDNMER